MTVSMTEMTAFLSTCARMEDCGSPAERGRAGFLEEEGRPELNLKGQFGSPKWPRVRRRSVFRARAQEPGSWAHLPAGLQGGGWGCHVSSSCHSVSLSRPRHEGSLSSALPGLGSEGRSRPLTCCEADRAGLALCGERSRWRLRVGRPLAQGHGALELGH